MSLVAAKLDGVACPQPRPGRTSLRSCARFYSVRRAETSNYTEGVALMGREANKEIVRRYRVALNTNQLQLLDDLVAADVTTHGFLASLSSGLTGGKLLHRVAIAAFPDLQITTDALIAEGDSVAERWTPTGTHTGAPVMRAGASGRTFAMT